MGAVAPAAGRMSASTSTPRATHEGRPVLWAPHPRQARFLSCTAFEVLGGGSGGGGKSDAIIAAPLRWVHREKHRALVIRRTYPELQELRDRAEALYLPLGARWDIGLRYIFYTNEIGTGPVDYTRHTFMLALGVALASTPVE